MARVRKTRPWMFGAIAFSFGVPQGFLTVAFPYLATKGGLSLAQVGAIMGIALSANFLRLLWLPACDLWSTLSRWAIWGTVLSAAAVLALALMPMRPEFFVAIAALAFISQAASTLPAIAGAGLMALCLTDTEKGQASGAWQGGNLFSTALGGATCLWFATHFGVAAGGIAAATLTLLGLAVMPWIHEPASSHSGLSLGSRLQAIGRDLLVAVRDPRCALFMLAVSTPIGTGAASSLWSGIATEWGASPDRITLVVGLGAALASALGALAYGAVAKHFDRFAMYMLTGLVLAVVAIAMAELPRSGSVFIFGVLAYAVMMGAGYAAYTAVILQVVGKGAAATKYSVVNAFGNLSPAYMPVILGLLHDKYSTRVMLWGEVLITFAALVLIWALAWMIGWNRRTAAALAIEVA